MGSFFALLELLLQTAFPCVPAALVLEELEFDLTNSLTPSRVRFFSKGSLTAIPRSGLVQPLLWPAFWLTKTTSFISIESLKLFRKRQETPQARYRIFKSKGFRGARMAAFVTNSKLLAKVYFDHRCPDYGRIEKLINGKYETVAEKAYGIRHADN
jgi:hypothetical protein